MMRDAYTKERAREYVRVYGPPDHPHLEYLNRMETIARFVPDGSVLDVACGAAHIYSVLRRPDYLGIDSSPHMIAIAREFFPEAHFEVCDAFECERYAPKNTVISLSFLIHLESNLHQDMLQRMWNTCKEALIFTIPIDKDTTTLARTESQESKTLITNISYQTFINLCQSLKPTPAKIYTQGFPVGNFGWGLSDVLVRITK